MTINEVTTRTSSLPATFGDDPYLDYGIEAATAGASFLKFDRMGAGFTYGMDATSLPLGTRLAANMPGVRIGWLKWVDGKPEKVLSLLSERRKIMRDELGDDDKLLWEAGVDPWKEAAELELVDGNGQQFIFSTSSFGGVKGVKKLCYDFARERRSRPGQVPLVELQQHWYAHPKYSKVWEPDFVIADWVDDTTLAPVARAHEAGDGHDNLPTEPLEFEPPPAKTPPEEPTPTPVANSPAARPAPPAAPVPVLKAKTPRF